MKKRYLRKNGPIFKLNKQQLPLKIREDKHIHTIIYSKLAKKFSNTFGRYTLQDLEDYVDELIQPYREGNENANS